MAYLMVETSIRTHPKFLAAGPDASWLWLCGLGYCQDGLTDGRIPTSALEYLGVKNPRKLAAKLVEVRLWEEVDGGWQMHDYFDHNKAAVEVRRIMKARAEGGKLGGRPRKPSSGKPRNLEGFEGEPKEQNLIENPLRPVHPGQPVLPEQPTEERARVAHDGPRLRVPRWQHEDLAKRLGSKVDTFDLLTWYGRLEDELARTGEAFADPWRWLQARLYRDAELPLPNLMGRDRRPARAEQFASHEWNCPHTPKCHNRPWCETGARDARDAERVAQGAS